MKKVFVDIYLQFNLGDDLFLDILAKKYPNCEFTVNYLGKIMINLFLNIKMLIEENTHLLIKLGNVLKYLIPSLTMIK